MLEDGEKYLEQDKELINKVIFTFYMNNNLEQAERLGEYYLNTYNTYKKQNKFHLTLSTKKATQLLSTFKKFFLKTKNTYDNLSDAYDVISTLFVLISTVKESIRSKKLK